MVCHQTPRRYILFSRTISALLPTQLHSTTIFVDSYPASSSYSRRFTPAVGEVLVVAGTAVWACWALGSDKSGAHHLEAALLLLLALAGLVALGPSQLRCFAVTIHTSGAPVMEM
jgi:hypothetical protein